MPSQSADARFWDRVARKYAKHAIKDPAGYQRTLDRTRELMPADAQVLELGCGTGTSALALAPRVDRIVATDISAEMTTIAREKAAAQDCRNIELTVATPNAMPWPDATFDCVLAFNLLHLVPARGEMLAAARRLLKPGGLLITKTPCLAEMNPLLRLAVPVMRAIGQAPYVDFFSGAELEREVASAGFAIVERARHGSGRKDSRVFLVARKPETGAPRDGTAA